MSLKKQIKRIHELLSEGEGSGTASSRSATSTASSGSYESPAAWEQGGILTKDTEPEIKGDLPPEVDITDRTTEVITVDIDDVFGKDPLSGLLDTLDDVLGDGGTYGAASSPPLVDEPTEDPYGEPEPPGPDPLTDDPPYTGPTKGSHGADREEPETDVNLWRSPPCCEPCEEKQGWWRRCRESEDDNPPCQYATISDCELADEKGASNITPLSLSNLWGEQY